MADDDPLFSDEADPSPIRAEVWSNHDGLFFWHGRNLRNGQVTWSRRLATGSADASMR